MDLELYRIIINNEPNNGMQAIFRAGFKEFNRLPAASRHGRGCDHGGTQHAVRVALSRETDDWIMLPFLATVGSTSPHVGTIWYVWGIMNSFRGLHRFSRLSGDGSTRYFRGFGSDRHGLLRHPAVIAYNRYRER